MSNSLQVTANIAFIKPIEQKGQYSVRTVFLDLSNTNSQTGEHYENFFPFQFWGDKCSLLDNFQKGQNVTIHFNLKGGKDKNTGKWTWANLQPWKIELAQAAQTATPASQQNWSNSNTSTRTQTAPPPQVTEILDDDLPF